LLAATADSVAPLPVALLLVGDYVAGLSGSRQPFLRRQLIDAFCHWNRRQQARIARRCLTFVNSRELLEQWRQIAETIVEVRTTTLNDDDFFWREDTCLSRPVRVLYTGRLDRAKGLFEAVQAVAQVVAAGEDVCFQFAGWAEPGDNIVSELMDSAQQRGIGDRVKYLGFKKLGSELFECYKEADIYLIASTGSEGFPRTILEAMAHSLPVVATAVGGIPRFLTDRDTALLVMPNDPRQLASALETLIGDLPLRKRLIENGFAAARKVTLERTTSSMLKAIRDYVAQATALAAGNKVVNR
jgi:glycosyltransferase involved in cell wall biosynthesis